MSGVNHWLWNDVDSDSDGDDDVDVDVDVDVDGDDDGHRRCWSQLLTVKWEECRDGCYFASTEPLMVAELR